MNKIIITISRTVIVAIVIGGLVFIKYGNINRIGTDQYYTQIEGKGKEIKWPELIEYEYELPAYDKDGKQKTLTFTSINKQLREKAYLILFVKDGQVTSYQEVTKKAIPDKVDKLK
ncbi:YxeA family protein [Cytobacillus sp. Hm23]